MHTAISLAPNGPGILPFRHRGYDQDQPPWDLHQRAALLGYEITGRDDSNTATSVGAWKEDTDTRGDLNCANYWQADYSQRAVGCWGFGYASVVQSQSSGGNNVDTRTSQPTNVLPLGMNGNPDSRFMPKTPIVAKPEGSPGGDPNAQGATPPGGDPGASGGAMDPNGVIDLGNGWQYQNGLIVQTGSSGPSYGNGYAGTLNPFGGGTFNPLGGTGIGGLSPGQGFSGFSYGGGQSLTGIPGVGFGSGFPGFSYGGGQSLSGLQGVGFGGSPGVKFTYTSGPAR